MSRQEEDQKARERSAAYQSLMSQWAFQDFLETVRKVKSDAFKSFIEIPTEQASERKFGELRGIVGAVDKIEKELDYILNWK